MRFEQIIAAVARSLNIVGVREISSIDAFAHASGLQLCMACVSPGNGMYSGSLYSGSQPGRMLHQSSWCHPSQQSNRAWLATVANTATGKRKRLPLTARLLGLAKRGSTGLCPRDC